MAGRGTAGIGPCSFRAFIVWFRCRRASGLVDMGLQCPRVENHVVGEQATVHEEAVEEINPIRTMKRKSSPMAASHELT